MTAQNEGVNWETVARAGAIVLFSMALGAGGFFISQQAAHDNRQDILLDSISSKMIDVTMTLVKVQQQASDAKAAADKVQTLQDERDRTELADYRHRAGVREDAPIPRGKK